MGPYACIHNTQGDTVPSSCAGRIYERYHARVYRLYMCLRRFSAFHFDHIEEIRITIEIPNSNAFPLLAQSIAAESARLSTNTGKISNQLNNLFAQLARLNKWQSENKRSLRTEPGQPLSKASRDTSIAIQDMVRYLPTKKQLQNAAQVKKSVKQSGVFLDAKLANNQLSQKQSRTPLHQDLKANIQRIISASLYHIAKIQTATTSSTTTLSTSSAIPTTPQQQSLLTPNVKTQPDLVNLVKQKLHNYMKKWYMT